MLMVNVLNVLSDLLELLMEFVNQSILFVPHGTLMELAKLVIQDMKFVKMVVL
jgi:hypothetical protein